ncbi:6-bladed beta-propeller [Candidatus Palauibacter sp.]|uniref:6-bladed beta-propeller n=1 Tax=Candidatus Palauibacter sp. TaxID=3101350 RepID=UPI003B027457
MHMPVFALAESAQGVVFVGGASEVFVFGRDGSYIRSLGRQGDGPGEFAFVSTLGLHGDTLWVGDPAVGRLTRFRPDGSVLETISPRPPGGLTLNPLFLAPDRSVVTAEPERMGAGLTGDPAGNRRIIWNRWQPNGPSAHAFVVAGVTRESMIIRGDGQAVRSVRQPFHDRTPIAFSGALPYALVGSHTRTGGDGTIFVERVHFDGTRDTALAVPYRAQRITGAIVDSVIHQLGRELSWRPGADEPPADPSPDIAGQLRAALYAPEYRPALWDLVQGNDGSIWVGRERSASGHVRWLVASESEGARAYIYLPVHQRPMSVTHTHVWISEPTDLDIGRVIKYRIDFP